jgi:transposase
MDLLAEGVSKTDIARQLRISRMTVQRYVTAAQEQEQPVPEPRPAGGYRHSKLTRTEIAALATLTLQHPKDTVQELQQRAIQEGLESCCPCESHHYMARFAQGRRQPQEGYVL